MISNRNFLIAFASCFASPVLAAESAPDLSGVWGRNSVDYERPTSGPGPVMSKTHTFYLRVGDDANPILKPETAEKVRAASAVTGIGENFPTPSNACVAWSPPYAWRALLMQIVQDKDQVLILYVGDQEIRHVRLNGTHPAQLTPSAMGDSIGHYEGETLVIDTVGIRFGKYSMIDNYGTPYSPALHLIERIRLIDGPAARRAAEQSERDSGRVDVDMGGASIVSDESAKGLQISFTVEDANVFTMPWSGTVTYRRSAGAWEERVCADGQHNYITGKDFDLPHATRPDF